MALVQQPQPFRNANVRNGIQGEEIRPSTAIYGQVFLISELLTLGEGLGANFVEVGERPLDLVGDLVFPALQVLKGIGRGQDLSLAGMIRLVCYICKMVVRACKEVVLIIFGARLSVAVDILDGADVTERQRISASSQNGLSLMEF